MVLMKVSIKLIKLHIDFINKIVGFCHNRYFFHNLEIMNRDIFFETDKYRDGSLQVHQGMYLEAALNIIESCPLVQCQTQLNGVTVKCANHFIKINSEFFSPVQFLGILYQDIAKILIDAPIIFLVPDLYKSYEQGSRVV